VIETRPQRVKDESELFRFTRCGFQQLGGNGFAEERLDACLHVPIAWLRPRLHLRPFCERDRGFLRLTDVDERICGNEPKLRRASRTSRRICTSACHRELSDDVLCNVAAACEREPQRHKLM